MGESVTEGSIVEWRKKVGQWVDEGETLVDVTTDKVDVEVPSTASGVITAVHGGEGDTIAVGTVLVEIAPSAEKPAASATPASASPAPVAAAPAPAATTSPTVATSGTSAGLASHKAKLLAERYHLDLGTVKGTGPDGLIIRADLDRALAAGTAK